MGASLVAALMVGTSGLALAQTNDDEIIVTATKLDQTIEEAPLSVSVVSSDIIANAGAVNFEELVTLVPTVVFSNAQSPIQSNVGIRGVSTAGGSAALEPSVGIYIDGIFTDRTSIGIGDFTDIAAVEVLRGPQATVFGNSSPAGIINFVTQRPDREFGGEIRATLGNFNRVQLAANVTGPLTETLSGRVAVFSHERDGYIENLAGPDSNDNDSAGIRAKLLWEPSDTFEALWSVEYADSKQNCCLPLYTNITQDMLDRFGTASRDFPFTGSGVPFPDNQVEDQVTAVDGLNRFEQESFATSLILDFDLGGHTLKSISSYREVEQFSQADIDFTALDLLSFPSVVRNNEQISQELRLLSPSDRPLTYILGAYYFEKTVDERSGLQINPQLAGLLGGNILPDFSPSGNDINNKNYALFGEGTYALTDRFSLTGGLRYNYDDKETTSFARRTRADGSDLSPPQSIPPAFQQRDGGELTGKIVAQYDWTDAVNSYVSYTRGYKAFGINDDANLLRNVPGASFFFDSEKVDNFEFGTKGTLDALNTFFSVVLFRTEYDDFQSLSSFTDENDNLQFFLQNAASLTSQGVEVDFNTDVTERFTLSGGFTILDASFDSFPDAQGPAGPLDLSGERLRDAPEFSGSLVARYEQPLGDTLELYGQGDVFYRSKVFTDQNLDPLEVQDDYAKINLRLGLGDARDRWALEFWSRNVTDEITFGRAASPIYPAVTGLLPFAGATPFPAGADTRLLYTGEPRTYGATLITRF